MLGGSLVGMLLRLPSLRSVKIMHGFGGLGFRDILYVSDKVISILEVARIEVLLLGKLKNLLN